MRAELAQLATAYQREARSILTERADFRAPNPELINALPEDAQGFYDILGHFPNSYTNKTVPTLAPFQVDCWNDLKLARFCLYPKSQKIGMTALFLMQDLWLALTRDRGREIFIVSQNEDKAIMHLRRLKNYLRESPRLRPFLIERPPRDRYGRILRDINSKVDVAAIHNPDRPRQPTLIIAVGLNALGGLLSNVNVGHIHMSDISAATVSEVKAAENFAAARSRLVNTRGTMVVETPPSGHAGIVGNLMYRIMDELGMDEEFEPDGRLYQSKYWVVRRLHWRLGLEHGLFPEEVIEAERYDLTPGEFARFYEASVRTDEELAYDEGMAEQVDDDATRVAQAFHGVGA